MQTHTLGSVISADGTTIGYRQLGSGPGLVLVHGGMMAAQNFMRLGALLADTFTVFIPDWRGRGTSGPYGSAYSVARDCEDTQALLRHSGARGVFGLSSGAIIALYAALMLPEIERVAAYEPPFSTNGWDSAHWVERFDREIAAGNLAGAFLTVMKGTGDSRLLRLVPDLILTPILRLGLRVAAREAVAGDVPIDRLIPTMHFDAQLVRESSAWFDKLGELRAKVLLLGGKKSAVFLKRALDALSRKVPQATRLELLGVGHLAADNDGKPALVANALRAFFT